MNRGYKMVESNLRRVAVIGRFQPFHNGHLDLIRQILQGSDEVVVVIGSAQLNYTFENPFTAGERVLMIRGALLEGGIDLSRIFIIPIVDEEDNALWYPKLVSMLPSFSALYSGNRLVTTLASFHLEVKSPKFVNKKQFNGTYIRCKIMRGEKWHHLVSKSVFDMIRAIDGVGRLRTLAKHESLENDKISELNRTFSPRSKIS
jgi:nicotinamide-nucleotide adenylyltransferase